MKEILFYLLQMFIISGLLYGYYHWVLRDNKFHRYNRFFLLISLAISCIVPLLNIPVYLSDDNLLPAAMLQPLQVITSPGLAELPEQAGTNVNNPGSFFTTGNILLLVYITACILFFFRILFSLKKIWLLAQLNKATKIGDIKFFNTTEPGTPFSFFRLLFWNRKIDLASGKGEQIFRHELFHIQQRHSWDVIFLEMLTAIFWINPFFHFIKKEIKAIHEFLADEFAIQENNKWQYAELLLMQALQTRHSLVNPFFHNQIKRRIAMITTSKKPAHQYLRKLMVLPIAAVILIVFAFSYKSRHLQKNESSNSPITIVIDPGHGGIDPGAKSMDGQYTEAGLSLLLAKKIESLAAEYNIKIVLTRTGDQLPEGVSTIKEALNKRVEIVNASMPSAFLSLHLAASTQPALSSVGGFKTYIANKKNNVKDRLLASQIITSLNDVYLTKNKLYQTNPGNLILENISTPSVYLEFGDIKNPKSVAFFIKPENLEKIAHALLRGIVKFSETDNDSLSQNYLLNTDTDKQHFLPESPAGSAMLNNSNISIPAPQPDTTKPQPLIVLDGKQMPGIAFSKIETVVPASDIERVDVLKGPSAIKKYGEKGKDGVIEITTKKKIVDVITVKEKRTDTEENNIIFEKTEVEPAFPGGEREWRRYLERNLDATIPSKNGCASGTYPVMVRFIVSKEGKISDVTALTNHGYGMEEHIIKLIINGPGWVPAIQNGRNVTAYRTQPVTFIVGNGSPVFQGSKTGNSQLNEVVVTSLAGDNQPIFEKVETEASFPGGVVEWRRFLEKNLDVNVAMKNKAPNGTYTAIIQYIVDEKGKISDLKKISNHGYGIEEECIRVLQLSPVWVPAMQNGKIVKSFKKQPVTFVVIN